MNDSAIYTELLKSSKQYDGWLYIGDDKCRYAIGEPGKYNLLVIGINPSTATPEKLDPTIRKVRKIVEQNEIFNGWVIINLYPLRNKDPKEMPEQADEDLSRNNVAVIKEILDRFDFWRIWAAWGDAIDTRDYYVEELNKIVGLSSQEWYHKGKMTRRGNPRHPLYLPDDAEFVWFPVADYLTMFSDEYFY